MTLLHGFVHKKPVICPLMSSHFLRPMTSHIKCMEPTIQV